MRRITAILLIASLAGCANTEGHFGRAFTPEQEAQLHEQCAPAGCVVVPLPLWEIIQERLTGERI